MRNKSLLIFFLVITLSGCAPKYLPSYDKIDVNPYGSYIRVVVSLSTVFTGELISIDSEKMVVLEEWTKQCITIKVADVKRFSLRYAKQERYGWAIPVFTLATISHGFFLVLTAPVNLIVAISTTAAGKRAFKYNKKDMDLNKLRMFARFPQGIPENIDLASIH